MDKIPGLNGQFRTENNLLQYVVVSHHRPLLGTLFMLQGAYLVINDDCCMLLYHKVVSTQRLRLPGHSDSKHPPPHPKSEYLCYISALNTSAPIQSEVLRTRKISAGSQHENVFEKQLLQRRASLRRYLSSNILLFSIKL
jgi:hypothetical protein